MMSKWLSKLFNSTSPRDLLTIASVGRVQDLMILCVLVSLVAECIFYQNTRVLVAVGVFGGLSSVLGVWNFYMLRTELRMRGILREKRLALPQVLAQGINAVELNNFQKAAESIAVRIYHAADFQPTQLRVFDCLLHDLMVEDPTRVNSLKNAYTPELFRQVSNS